MSIGRLLTVGLGSFAGVNYLPTLGLGDYDDEDDVENITTRLSLIGTSRQRLAIEACDRTRIATIGTSRKRHGIEGASR